MASAVDWSRAEQVDVTLVDFSFRPSRIVLEHGHPYRLHLENRGSGGHNFDAPDFFRSVVLREDAATELRDGKGAVELARDEVKDITISCRFGPGRSRSSARTCFTPSSSA